MPSPQSSRRRLRVPLSSASVLVAVAVTVAAHSACSTNSGVENSRTQADGGSSSGGASSGGDAGSGAVGGISTTGGSAGSINIDAGTGNTGGAISGDADCGGQSLAAEQVTTEEEVTEEVTERLPADIFVMMDQSGSMGSGAQPWDPVKNAFIQFVQSPESAGMGIGIQYFPLDPPQVTCVSNNNPAGCSCIGFCPGPLCLCFYNAGGSCNVSDYATPDVPLQLLPGVAQAIIDSLNRHGPSGGTPTYPALQGAIQYASQYASTNGGRKTIVVLATDGEPNDCSSNVTNVSQVAAAGLAGNPSIQTFVIGIGNIANLNTIAQAGGTNQALIVDPANAGQQFLDAMNQIRGSITQTVTHTVTHTTTVPLDCEWVMPAAADGQKQDPTQVNVNFTTGGVQQSLGMVVDEADCAAHQNGWYYDSPTDPTKLIACPDACDAIKTATDARIDIIVGCETTIAPPA
jgi:Mg-chelatase subunit ChlD